MDARNIYHQKHQTIQLFSFPFYRSVRFLPSITFPCYIPWLWFILPSVTFHSSVILHSSVTFYSSVIIHLSVTFHSFALEYYTSNFQTNCEPFSQFLLLFCLVANTPHNVLFPLYKQTCFNSDCKQTYYPRVHIRSLRG